MTTCGNCYHKRQFHKKVDGNAWCSVSFCACKEFIERKIAFNRRKIHDDLDQYLDGLDEELSGKAEELTD